jgi:hypothetical protein
MTSLPVDFQFSQNNLQDYADCPLRFELRHLLHREWPALKSEPALEFEHRTELGVQFHEMVHQSLSGVPAEQIAVLATDPDLAGWWNEFSTSTLLSELPALRRVEFSLSAPFAGYRLIAKYDLLAIEPGQRAVIVDWKTAGKPPSRSNMANRFQSKVYPYLMVTAGATLNGGKPFRPEQVEMIYWFTNEPGQPMHFQYSQQQYQADGESLAGWAREIAARPAGQFPMTLDEKKCLYCVYRSLCNRGTRAGDWQDAPDEIEPNPGLDVPFDQIGEIEF